MTELVTVLFSAVLWYLLLVMFVRSMIINISLPEAGAKSDNKLRGLDIKI